MTIPSVELYTQHIAELAQLRLIITTMKSMMDTPAFRTALINLNTVQPLIAPLTFPADLVGRIQALSLAIEGFETTVSTIENGVRGALLYPA